MSNVTPERGEPMKPLAIETKGLSKRFGKHVAVRDLNLSVPAGTLFGLIGPNGAGKTTTLRMLAGLIPPSKGSIHLGGQQVDAMRHESKVSWKVGYMPDFFGVYEDMLVWEYLDFFARCYGVAPDQRARLVDELLELVDLSGKRESDVETLSRGMKQRLCLAHALVHDPDILLLDEPASGLDPRARLEMRELLLELRAMGKTIVISSHILTEMGEMCDSVAIMEQGKLLAGGDVEDIERSVSPGQAVELRALAGEAQVRAALEALPGIHLPPLAEAEDAYDRDDADNLAGAGGDSSIVDDPAEADMSDSDSASKPASAQATEIVFFVEGEPDAHATVLAALVGAGIQVVSYRPRERDLERMFMEITKGEVS
jgi:ABC-2 type transport system ATP-binding protein